MSDFSFDRFLGSVTTNADGEPVTWAACLGQDGGSWERCMKNWMADKAGIPVGDQYLLGIIMGLFTQGEALLGLLLLVFSVGFPLTKVALMVWLSSVGPASAPRPFRLLKLTSKWSMTDVFVVALLITFFKAESFNFHFEAELGVYLFAAGAILSSLGVHLLERAKGPAGSGPGAVA